MLLRVEGLRLGNHKDTKVKHKTVIEASSKQEVWNNPKSFGFSKIFKVSLK